MSDSGAVAHYHPPTREPGDAQPPGRDDMALPGYRRVPAQRAVVIRIEGRWQAGTLTEWRWLTAGYWVANVRWRDDPERPAEGWCWVRYDPAVLRPRRDGAVPSWDEFGDSGGRY